MKKERLDILEVKVSKLTKVVEDMQRKMEYVQRIVSDKEGVVPLSTSATVAYEDVVDASRASLTPSQQRTLAVAMNASVKGITSQDAAKVTARSINLESAILHKLSLQGFLQRSRVGRKVYYRVRGKA